MGELAAGTRRAGFALLALNLALQKSWAVHGDVSQTRGNGDCSKYKG